MIGLGLSIAEVAGRAATAAAVATTTWNSADKTASLSLSNGDLTWTGTAGAYAGVRSVASASSGKKYWEQTVVVRNTGANLLTQGFGNSSAVLANFLGSGNTSIGWAGDGAVYRNGGSIATVGTYGTVNDVLCFAFDIGGMLIWFRPNGGNWNNSGAANPATGVGGIDISALAGGPYFAIGQAGTTSGDSMTANFGGSAYAQAVPSGFGNW